MGIAFGTPRKQPANAPQPEESGQQDETPDFTRPAAAEDGDND